MDKAKIALRLALLLVVAVAPFVALTLWVWQGALGVAFYGVLGSALCWIIVGTRITVLNVLAIAVLSIVAMLCYGSPLATGVLVLALGIGYGFAASKGLGPALLQIPILVPYFAMEPPPLFSDATPTIDAGYLLAVAFVVAFAGLWIALLLHLAMPHKTFKTPEVPDRNQALLYGAMLGIFSSAVVVAATIWNPESHWAWLVLTLYVLSNPTHLLDWTRLGHRVLGTALGFVLVIVIFWLPVPAAITTLLVIVCLWFAVYAQATKKPYWFYVIFLTASVVSMVSINSNHDLYAVERIEFTLAGALLAIAVAFVTNVVLYRKPAVRNP